MRQERPAWHSERPYEGWPALGEFDRWCDVALGNAEHAADAAARTVATSLLTDGGLLDGDEDTLWQFGKLLETIVQSLELAAHWRVQAQEWRS